MLGRAGWIAHVVQAVEMGDEIEAAPRIIRRAGHVERDAVGHSGLAGPLIRCLDRRSVHVEAKETALRIRLGHKDGRSPVPAADVGRSGPGGKLGLDAVQRGNPRRDQIATIVRAEESFGAGKQSAIVLAPIESAAGAKVFDHPRLGLEQRRNHFPRARNEIGAILIGQCRRLLGRQGVFIALRVIGDIPARGLIAEPFANIALRRTGLPRQIGDGHRAGTRHRFIKSELVADQREHGAHRSADVSHRLPKKRLHPRFVDWHGTDPSPYHRGLL